MIPFENERPRILLVAPNVSRRMGGEAIKALNILEGYLALGFDVTQVTHARVRPELSGYACSSSVVYIEDGPVQIQSFRLGLYWIVGLVGTWLLHREVQRQIDRRKPWIVHFTAPISPLAPYFRLKRAPVVIGPLNGNLLHPPTLLHRESRSKLLGAKLTAPVALANRLFCKGKQHALLLVSGGDRTTRVLAKSGCRADQIVMTLDSGVDQTLIERPRITHSGTNWRFVFVGRLVRYKGCDLAIRALKQVPKASLEIIGDGPERAALQALAEQEGVSDRVEFCGYTTDRDALFVRLARCRAFVFPSLAEANGIVTQEAMMLGLPAICVDWGGAQQLLDPTMAVMIEPADEQTIVRELAGAMSMLACDPVKSDTFSRRARAKAEREGFAWPDLLQSWLRIYDYWLEKSGSPMRIIKGSAEDGRVASEGGAVMRSPEPVFMASNGGLSSG